MGLRAVRSRWLGEHSRPISNKAARICGALMELEELFSNISRIMSCSSSSSFGAPVLTSTAELLASPSNDDK